MGVHTVIFKLIHAEINYWALTLVYANAAA